MSAVVFFDVDGTLVPEISSAVYLAGRGLALDRCASIGDSLSDLPLFGAAGPAIGFNATPKARALAYTNHNGPDLRVVLPTLGAWLGC